MPKRFEVKKITVDFVYRIPEENATHIMEFSNPSMVFDLEDDGLHYSIYLEDEGIEILNNAVDTVKKAKAGQKLAEQIKEAAQRIEDSKEVIEAGSPKSEEGKL